VSGTCNRGLFPLFVYASAIRITEIEELTTPEEWTAYSTGQADAHPSEMVSEFHGAGRRTPVRFSEPTLVKYAALSFRIERGRRGRHRHLSGAQKESSLREKNQSYFE